MCAKLSHWGENCSVSSTRSSDTTSVSSGSSSASGKQKFCLPALLPSRIVAARGRGGRRGVGGAAAGAQGRPAGKIERQRKREADPLLHLRDSLQHFLARHVVHAPALVVGAE